MSKVTTFYSYKGGSGRSMTMANVAWALATNGEKVLAIDWDLEAPGLHRYFHPFLDDPEQARSDGLVDRIWDYIRVLGNEGAVTAKDYAVFKEQVQELELPWRGRGCLHFLGAGKQDEHYSEKVGGLDWSSFYARFDGKEYIDRMMRWARQHYSHILIDSRTGVADTAGICTAQVPDTVVMCFVYNRQSIEGTAAVTASIQKMCSVQERKPMEFRVIPTRVEERGVVDSARRYAATRLAHSLRRGRSAVEQQLRRNEVRHFPWCAFEEKLAVFEDVPDERGSLLEAMHELAGDISGRKNIRIAHFEPLMLEAIWRRAAFDDPRIADLEALAEATTDRAYSQLYEWMDEALAQRDERPDWLMALAEALVEHAGAFTDRVTFTTADLFGRSALRFAERAYEADAEQYRIRYALLLQQRSSQLHRSSDLDAALALARTSVELLDEDKSPVSRWRRARSLERMAEIFDAMDRDSEALETYRASSEAYNSIDRRALPLAAELDPARSCRILAEKELAYGNMANALVAAEHAVRRLPKGRKSRRTREVTEVINILATRAKIAVQLDPQTARNETFRIRHVARDGFLSDEANDELERRLLVIEAEALSRFGAFDEGIDLLQHYRSINRGSLSDPLLLEAEIELLLEAGREFEALDRLQEALDDDKFPLSTKIIDLAQRGFSATGQKEHLLPILIARLDRSEGKDNSALQRALTSYLVQRLSETSSEPWQSRSLVVSPKSDDSD